MKIKSIKLLLPAIFLLVLGIGNLLVGYYKEWQYSQVYQELIELEPTQTKLKSGSLDRIQTTKTSKDRRKQHQLEAYERLNLYKLVSFGGKVFIGVSLLMFYLSLLNHYKIFFDNSQEVSE